MENLPRNKQFTLIGIAFVVVVLFAIGSFTTSQNRRSNTAEEYSPSDAPAVIADSEKLYSEIDNDRQFMSLREDIGEFALLAVPAYQGKTTAEVVFNINGAIRENNGELSFSGSYNNDSDSIRVVIKKLGSDRIKTSITNLKNEGNIDSRLPSNSKENQFIGTLPFRNDLFSVEYNSSTKSFTITALNPDSSVRQQATDYIVNGTGKPKAGLKILFKPYLF